MAMYRVIGVLQVLNPMEVVWQSSAPVGRGPHMDVLLNDDVVFNICPAVVRILMATLQTLPKAEVRVYCCF